MLKLLQGRKAANLLRQQLLSDAGNCYDWMHRRQKLRLMRVTRKTKMSFSSKAPNFSMSIKIDKVMQHCIGVNLILVEIITEVAYLCVKWP